MNTITTNTVDEYFATLADLKSDVKIGLIKKLADSLQTTIKSEVKGEKDDSWKELAGAWEDDREAEEIIAEIRESRHFADEDKKEGDDIIDQLAGAWHDYGKTAEEIIADIRESRYSDKKDIKL